MCSTEFFRGSVPGVRRHVTIVVVLAAALSLFSADAMARSPLRHYSPSLGAKFYWDRFNFPGYGTQWAACVESLDDDSPLHQAGVRPGDIVTRLDDVRIRSLRELDRHYCWTTIRFFRSHGDNPYRGDRSCYDRKVHIPSSDCDD